MIQGHRNSKLSEGPQKFPEKSVPQKLHQKNKALPEKTKFTLQYNSQTTKNAGHKVVRSLTPEQSRVLRSSRGNITAQGVEDGRGKTVRDQKSSQTDSKQAEISDERKISSLPFLKTPSTMGAESKSSVTTGRKLTKISVAVKTPTDSRSCLIPRPEHKRSTPLYVPKCTPSQCKAEMRVTAAKLLNLKKTTNSPSGSRLKESEKSIKSMTSTWKKSVPSSKAPESRVQDTASTKQEDEPRPNIPERARRKCLEEERKVVAKERSRSQEVKRATSKESSVKLGEVADRKRSEGKILFNGLERSTSHLGLSKRNWETGNMALNIQERTFPVDPAPVVKDIVFAMPDSVIGGEDLKKSKSRGNVVGMTDHDSNMQSYSSHPSEDYPSLDSLERTRRDEDLLSLDKRIWSNLEVQIRETCEKTDILYDSGDDSGESASDIINRFFSNEEHLADYLEQPEARISKHPNSREDWNSLAMDSKSKPEKEKVKVESKTKDLFERPKSRRATEETFGRKISQESKRTKSSEDSKIRDSKQEFRTISLSGGIKWTNFRDDSHGKVKERKTVNFLDDYKLGSKCVSSSFFHTHKNVGFIGRDVDEEYVSFEPGQVTLYHPHESQMLLYDIANCAATQGYLKMCGIMYDVAIRKNAEQMSPSGRVPFISSSLCIIPEFEAIVSFMQYKKFTCIPVKENDKPAFRGIISMIVDVLETAERYICWYDDTTLMNYTRPRIGGQFPFPLNHIMHWKKRHEERSRLAERGYSGRSFDKILGEISSCFRTLSRRLGNNAFFFGNVGTEVDALVYGHVYAIFTTDVDGPLRDLQFIIQQYPNLVSFACNFDKTFSIDKFPSLQLSYWDNILTDGGYTSDASFTVRT